jgi:hypothetical protein
MEERRSVRASEEIKSGLYPEITVAHPPQRIFIDFELLSQHHTVLQAGK